eukprot:TRINITY_DN2971_c0_g1_i1.p1 TRINITY_DN2971_c0_g1~~TRINITY_DN2971_c0_g1_i1.p1  ORF type:complete len:398 (-),score=63.37 TRINITY_DN2971_c0_g1_i1:18-1211(-)
MIRNIIRNRVVKNMMNEIGMIRNRYGKDKLYKTHIPTNFTQKMILGIGSALTSFYNPERADMVACLGDLTSNVVVDNIYEKMVNDKEGRSIIKEKPIIRDIENMTEEEIKKIPTFKENKQECPNISLDTGYLRSLSDKTFGKQYINWMDHYNFNPNSRPYSTFIDDIERADMVACLGDLTSNVVVDNIYEKMVNDKEGRSIIKEKPIIRDIENMTEEEIKKIPTFKENKQECPNISLDTGYLRSLSDKTFGKQYINWMDHYNFNPNSRPYSTFIDDIERAYVIQRYREIHDFIHVLFDLDVTVMNEVAIKSFESLHFNLPSSVLSTIMGPLRCSNDQERKFLMNELIPWTYQTNKNASKFLLNIYYENYFNTDIDEFRDYLGITKAPKYKPDESKSF